VTFRQCVSPFETKPQWRRLTYIPHHKIWLNKSVDTNVLYLFWLIKLISFNIILCFDFHSPPRGHMINFSERKKINKLLIILSCLVH
jgi:hypothetical protein